MDLNGKCTMARVCPEVNGCTSQTQSKCEKAGQLRELSNFCPLLDRMGTFPRENCICDRPQFRLQEPSHCRLVNVCPSEGKSAATLEM